MEEGARVADHVCLDRHAARAVGIFRGLAEPEGRVPRLRPDIGEEKVRVPQDHLPLLDVGPDAVTAAAAPAPVERALVGELRVEHVRVDLHRGTPSQRSQELPAHTADEVIILTARTSAGKGDDDFFSIGFASGRRMERDGDCGGNGKGLPKEPFSRIRFRRAPA